ncbi:MAG: folylpolyglutamate synthase/dihydrofolate synthase family protein [Ignavibacteria bacterium]
MDFNSAINRLYSLQKMGMKLGLDNIRSLMAYLGNPHESLKCFHIAGSNGKGSTASFMASILMENGYKTGLYTSPHFIRYNERIRINREEIPDNYVINFIGKIDRFISEQKSTFFEVTTALAFQYFADEKVDYAVIETGLGGRLDATNIITPVASVITSISFEHTEILGETIGDISAEKGGIIKSKSKVFLGRMPFKAKKVLSDIAETMGSITYKVTDYIYLEENAVNFYSGNLTYKNVETPLKGIYQRYNAALAILTLSETINLTNSTVVQNGIDKVVENSGIQGRYEIFLTSPRVIFDSAHNFEGVNNFLNAFRDEASNYAKRILLFGVMKDKAIFQMLEILSPYFDEIHFTSIEIDRAATIADLSIIADSLNIKYSVEKDGAVFIRSTIKGNKNICLVVLGSMYVLGDIKKKLLTQKNT